MAKRINYLGVGILVIETHAEADRFLEENGWAIPAIPPGCNTSLFYFETKDGLQALAINQKGFQRGLEDNEQEVNGCSIFVCLDRNLDLIDARAVLKKLYEH